MKTGGSRACEGPPLALAPLHQLIPICHLLHHLLLHEEEVHALHLALLRLLAGVPGADAPQCESFVMRVSRQKLQMRVMQNWAPELKHELESCLTPSHLLAGGYVVMRCQLYDQVQQCSTKTLAVKLAAQKMNQNEMSVTSLHIQTCWGNLAGAGL